MYKNRKEIKKSYKRKVWVTFSYKSSREYLTHIFLNKVKEMKYTSATVSTISNISRGTLSNMKRGRLPNLPTLFHLFSSPFPFQPLTPEEARLAVISLISDSLIDSPRSPLFQIDQSPESPLAKPLPSLPAYMKQLRTHHLQWSVRETCLMFEHCDTLQMSRIELDCRRVGIGPVCYLFHSYLAAIHALTDEEWGMFATLLLHHLFPFLSGYSLSFIGYIERR
jgi:hypothetical protein